MLSANTLTERVKLYSAVKTKVNGDITETYTLIKTVWANVRGVTFKQQLQSNVEVMNNTFTVLCRYIKDLSIDTKVEYKGIKYDIIKIDTDVANGSMILAIQLNQDTRQEVKS